MLPKGGYMLILFEVNDPDKHDCENKAEYNGNGNWEMEVL